MAKRRETRDQLRERILAAMLADIGISERMAQPFVESVMQCFAGEQPYFPAVNREPPVSEIRVALENGESRRSVMRRYRISRVTLHKMFPEGVPKPLQTG